MGHQTSAVSWERCAGPSGSRVYSRKREEFMADFALVSRRALDERDQALFRYHYLLGADWRMCCRRLKIDKGTFFHRVYSIEERLGRSFAELAPYPLYPVAEYFAGVERQDVGQAFKSMEEEEEFLLSA